MRLATIYLIRIYMILSQPFELYVEFLFQKKTVQLFHLGNFFLMVQGLCISIRNNMSLFRSMNVLVQNLIIEETTLHTN